MTDDVVCHKRDGAQVVNWKLCLHSLDALAELGERAGELLAARRRRHREACKAWRGKRGRGGDHGGGRSDP